MRVYEPQAASGCLESGLLVAVAQAGHLNAIRSSQTQPTITTANGLLDTGADSTCISPALAKQVGLTPTGKVPVQGVGGLTNHNQYLVDLALRFGQEAIGIENLTLTEFYTVSPHFDVLIGRDVICRGVLTMDFNGRFTFSI